MNNKDTKKGLKTVIKWALFVLMLILATVISTTGKSGSPKPILLIPLSVSIAMFHSELTASIIGAFSGLILDTILGKLEGINAILLLIFSVAVAFLCLNLLKNNIVNAIIMTSVTTVSILFFDYFFNYYIFNGQGKELLIENFIVPSIIYTVLFSPIVYLVVKIIVEKTGKKEEITTNF